MSGMTAEQYCSQIRNRALSNISDKIIKNLKVTSICETTKRFINKELEDEQLMLFSVGFDFNMKDLKIIASVLCFNLLYKIINETVDVNNHIIKRTWVSEE
jgi:hypothetical protein